MKLLGVIWATTKNVPRILMEDHKKKLIGDALTFLIWYKKDEKKENNFEPQKRYGYRSLK